MAVAALVLYLVWFGVAFVMRTIVQVRRTGDTGWRAGGLAGRGGPTERVAALLFVVALLVGVAAPVADLAGVPVIAAFKTTAATAIGIALAVLGVGMTLFAQLSMGDAWRIGVDPSEQTELATRGAFAIVRNPIFSAMLVTAVGLALMVPNLVAIVGLAALVIALELQVRAVEEPYLRQLHGATYEAYATCVGRFAPVLGRLPQPSDRRRSR